MQLRQTEEVYLQVEFRFRGKGGWENEGNEKWKEKNYTLITVLSPYTTDPFPQFFSASPFSVYPELLSRTACSDVPLLCGWRDAGAEARQWQTQACRESEWLGAVVVVGIHRTGRCSVLAVFCSVRTLTQFFSVIPLSI